MPKKTKTPNIDLTPFTKRGFVLKPLAEIFSDHPQITNEAQRLVEAAKEYSLEHKCMILIRV